LNNEIDCYNFFKLTLLLLRSFVAVYDFTSVKPLLLRLSWVLYYALCLSYYSNTEAALFACLSSGWATTTLNHSLHIKMSLQSVYGFFRINLITRQKRKLRYMKKSKPQSARINVFPFITFIVVKILPS